MGVKVDVAEASSRTLLRPGQDPFYVPPSGFASLPPGTVLRSRRVAAGFFGVIPQRVVAWQLLYRSTNLHHEPEGAVTTVLLPPGTTGPVRHVLGYQCAIDTVTDRGFPSYALRRGARAFGAVPPLEWPIIARALEQGWAISVADHEGLHGNFAAPREPGYRVLDGLRAALAFAPLRLAGCTVGLWGYSGGGMASAWAAELAADYAPELDLVGAVLGSPVGDPGQALIRLNGTMAAGLPLLGIAAMRRLYPALREAIDDVASPAAHRHLHQASTLPTVIASLRFAFHDLDRQLKIPLADVLAQPGILAMLRDLRLGTGAPECPLLVLQSVHDQIISIQHVDTQVSAYTRAGTHVTYIRDRCSEHLSLHELSVPAALDWLTHRFAGTPLPPASTRTVWSIAASRKGIQGLLHLSATTVRVLLGRPLRGAPAERSVPSTELAESAA